MRAFARLVAALANAAHVEFGRRIKFIVAASRNASAVNAFVESVIRAGRSVDDSVCQGKISRRLLESTIQFAFVFAIQAVLWHPLRIIQRRHVEAIVVESTALFAAEVERLVGTVLDVTGAVLNLLSDAELSAVRRQRVVAISDS